MAQADSTKAPRKTTARSSATKSTTNQAKTSPAKQAPRKTAKTTVAGKTGAVAARSREGEPGRGRAGADWDATKEMLAAHRTLARAERRETALASALKAHAKTVKTLQAEVKKADRLLAVEQRGTAKTSKADKSRKKSKKK